jgi:CRISPR/Cas system CMR-associated protein Cmr5 small subunit
MSTTIQGNGLFSEAAYGAEGDPGEGPIAGGSEGLEGAQLAWSAAMASAESKLPNLQMAGSLGAQGEPQAGDAEGQVMASADVKDSHPLSWDRLSMTVASMVAWNMQAGMADDIPAEPVLSGGLGVEAKVLSLKLGEFSDPSSALGGQDSTGLLAQDAQALRHVLSQGGQALSEPLVKESSVSSLDKGAQAGDPAVLAGASKAGLTANPLAKNQGVLVGSGVSEALQTVLAHSEMASFIQGQQTVADSAIGLGAKVETATIGQDVSALPKAGEGLKGQAQLSGVKFETQENPRVNQGRGLDRGPSGLDAIKNIRGSQSANAKQSPSMVRLNGVKAVLSALETQATLRDTIAAVQQSIKSSGTANQAVAQQLHTQQGQGKSPVNSEAKMKVAVSAHRARSATQKPDAGNPGRTFGRTDDAQVLKSRPDIDIKVPDGTEKADPSQNAKQPVVKASATQTEMAAVLTGRENAEISADQDTVMEFSAVDAQTIESAEVPDLAIGDVSSLDFDIEDPAGMVRVEVTREAESVAVRMETPSEVLEEYRQMQSEMEASLSGQGLDLSEFGAFAQGESDAQKSDNSSESGMKKESNQGEDSAPAVGAQALEQTGSTSRLVNHIV